MFYLIGEFLCTMFCAIKYKYNIQMYYKNKTKVEIFLYLLSYRFIIRVVFQVLGTQLTTKRTNVFCIKLFS